MMMKGMAVSRVLPLVLLALTACAGQGGLSSFESRKVITQEVNVYPADYKAEILAFLRSYLNNPANIRNAAISEPALKPAGAENRYAVCLRFNARKSSGDYEGSRDRLVFFLSGKLDTMIEAKRDQCANADYRPFPGLEQLKR